MPTGIFPAAVPLASGSGLGVLPVASRLLLAGVAASVLQSALTRAQ